LIAIKGKKIVVVGLGKSGEALARFLATRGAVVTLTDRSPAETVADAVKRLGGVPITFELGGHSVEAFTRADLIILSPGVPHTIAPVRAAIAAGVPVIGEIEFAARFIRTPIVAVTGTNGKSTVTQLVAGMLAMSGLSVFVGGNIGTPLIAYADSPMAADVVVAEISSFQLDTIVDFRPRVGVLLNITADHLDRYDYFAAYGASKGRLFENMGPEDTAVLNAADPMIMAVTETIDARKCLFDIDGPAPCGGWITPAGVTLRFPGTSEMHIPESAIPLVGRHNRENVAAAGLAALAAGATAKGIVDAVSGFSPDRHRIEYVATKGGVNYYDDSKGTNVDAVVRAIEAVPGPVVLIAGGRDKGGGYDALREPVRRSVKFLVVLGEAAGNIASGLGDLVETRHAGSMADAVRLAAGAAVSGDTVLLSPACSSFDMYESYAHRGDDFQNAVRSLAGAPS